MSNKLVNTTNVKNCPSFLDGGRPLCFIGFIKRKKCYVIVEVLISMVDSNPTAVHHGVLNLVKCNWIPRIVREYFLEK